MVIKDSRGSYNVFNLQRKFSFYITIIINIYVYLNCCTSAQTVELELALISVHISVFFVAGPEGSSLYV